MYTLKQMEAFYWSAVLGSFSASSQKLHTTQSAIAKRVAELESFAGGALLNRQSRALTLTAQGRKLFDLAGEMLELNTRIALRMGDAHTLEGTVRLGTTELIGLTWLATLIDQSTRRYPRLQLLPEIDGGMTLYKRLAEDSLDVALMPGPFWSYEYDCVPLASIRNVWMASPRLGIDTSQVLSPFDLVQHPVITQPTNSALTHLYDAWFAEQGMGVKRVLTCNSLGLVAQLTMLGLGISYLLVFRAAHEPGRSGAAEGCPRPAAGALLRRLQEDRHEPPGGEGDRDGAGSLQFRRWRQLHRACAGSRPLKGRSLRGCRKTRARPTSAAPGGARHATPA
ncbi:LysR-family transcriptional regulator [plant metagenome]|uniref:LysR-family transcriptional regulator n=1 Tax=plant metagenome TaxID=1297885 RepID=A0A484V7Y4_9ZZZZ